MTIYSQTRNWRKRMGTAILIAVLALLGLAAAQVDDWSRDLTTNQAATDPLAEDPLMRPIETRASFEEVQAAVEAFVADREQWKVEGVEQVAGAPEVIRLIRTTRWLRFVDDVSVGYSPGKGPTLIAIRSSSRVGKGDLGQNPRNVRELGAALRESLGGSLGE